LIALDTNVLVRFIVRDDEVQFALARDLIAACTPEWKGFISREVIIELCWVLERTMKFSRMTVAQTLTRVARADMFEMEERLDVQSAILAYQIEGFDFADLMIAAAAKRAGASELVTFDKRLASLPKTRLLRA